MTDAAAIRARRAVQSMVGDDIHVSVDIDRNAGPARPPSHSMTAGTIVSVEMYGREGMPRDAALRVSMKGEALAWAVEEIVSAARRAAERILLLRPTWRRGIQTSIAIDGALKRSRSA